MEVTDFDPAIKYCNKAIYLDPKNLMHGQPKEAYSLPSEKMKKHLNVLTKL